MPSNVLAFTLTGAYQLTETFTIHSNDPLVHADAGRIAGAWHLTFEDGTSGSCHVHGAATNRITALQASLFGTMQLDMFEVTGDRSRTDYLYLAFESSDFEIDNPTIDITVEGHFVGGTGRYIGASGTLRFRSVNGYIAEGSGAIVLDDGVSAIDFAETTEAETRAAVATYFEATQSGDAARWADRFTEDAVVEDPVGQSILKNRADILNQGKQFIESFEEVGLYPAFVQVAGTRAAAKWNGRGITKDGRRVEFEGINVWEFTPDGRVQKLKGYWNPANMREVDG